MLRAVHSNRVEALRDSLFAALPALDPFAPSLVVVGSRLVGRWLVRELAFARGIVAGLELVTFPELVAQVWAGDHHAHAVGLTGLDRSALAAAIASALTDRAVVARLPQVAAYLDAAPTPGDRAAPRRVQFADHLAALAWSYAQTRPDWMPALLTGRVPSELAGDPSAEWQAQLIAAALQPPAGRAWAPTPCLPWLRRRLGLPPPRLAQPLFVFGMSYLARAQLEALDDLAATTEVTVYALDPCQELWDDVPGRHADRDEHGVVEPLPLVMWGRAVRDTVAALIERTQGDIDAVFVADPEPATALAHLRDDARTRASHHSARPAHDRSGQAGVAIHACPNARREVEVVADDIRRRLDADPTLHANDIAVWVAGEADYYLAQAPSAFEAVGVPCHLVDAPVDDRGRIGEAVLALLELPTSQMARRDLLRVMTHPAVLAGHPHADGADWVRWTERLGIAHGADVRAHADTYLADLDGIDLANGHGGFFHWDQGVRRLALGAFMVGERGHRGPARLAGSEVIPEELRPDQQASAASYALLVRSLCADAAWLATLECPLTEWADVCAALLDQYLTARDDEARRDCERVRALLASLGELDLDGRRVGFREARQHVARMIGDARASRGEPLASGVLVAPLTTRRALPVRIAYVLGLTEAAFPASDQASPLDLRRESRRGDVSARDRDRAAFLEVLLCARDAIALSYVAVEPKSGQPLGPSSVVHELVDALVPYLGDAATASRQALAALTVHHPLHRFGGEVPALGSERERWACEVRDAIRRELRARGYPIPSEDDQLALLSHPAQQPLRAALAIDDIASTRSERIATRTLTIANLRNFLEYPIQAWAQAVLGLDELPDDEVIEHSDEPFHLARPRRAALLRDVFAAHVRGDGPLAALYDRATRESQLRGAFPVGVFAEAARALDLDILAAWRRGAGHLAELSTTRHGFGRAFASGVELAPALSIELAPGRTVRLVGHSELLARVDHRYASLIPIVRKLERRTAYHLRGAIDHVVLAAAGIANRGHLHCLIDPQGRASEIHHEPWSVADATGYLAMLARELLDDSHGYLLPFEVLARALAGRPSPRVFGDPTGGLGYGPIERPDGLAMPNDVIAIAERRLRPLVERMRGDHGFEIHRAGPPSTIPPPPPAPPPATPPSSPPSRPQLRIIKGGL